MTRVLGFVLLLCALTSAHTLNAGQDEGRFHEDYYLGFSQGAYYGLMLAGVDYEVAWCVKGELDYAGASLGAGSEFQQKIEAILTQCREAE